MNTTRVKNVKDSNRLSYLRQQGKKDFTPSRYITVRYHPRIKNRWTGVRKWFKTRFKSGYEKLYSERFPTQVIFTKGTTIAKRLISAKEQLATLKLPTDVVLMAYDVEACYPSIPISDGLQTL